MHRSLRFQLIAIAIATVAVVLGFSQWLDTTLSERMLEQDLRERALLVLGTVGSVWERSEPTALRTTLATLMRGNPSIEAIDIFDLGRGAPELEVTTRPEDDIAPTPEAADVRELDAGHALTRRTSGHGESDVWRVALPLRRDGHVVGAARVDVSLAEAEGLKHWLRRIDLAFLVFSIGFISLVLSFFLERRVARPVAALVAGMRQGETGVLGARVEIERGGEFGFLARAFNRMLARIEDLTAGLEARVSRATHDLAEKNRELQEANEKLWHAQREVSRSERLAALGQMAATIAHELGTPLNSILGYTQLLLREEPSAEQAAKLGIVESQVQRMIEAIQSVLDRTRERHRSPVAVRPLVEEVLGLVSSRLAGREIVARNDVPGDLPPVPGDPAALRQVLLNLLTNAIDASAAPGVITVAAVVLAANGRGGPSLEIAVHDRGHGMTPEELQRAFEPFYTTKAPGRGTGLGLAIVDHIVRAHAGRVVVETTPGEGTTMRVHLPLEAS
jgi:signal transduction histidine kinase